jgi:hypothetical protein
MVWSQTKQTPILKYKCDLNPIQMCLVLLGGKKKRLIFTSDN